VLDPLMMAVKSKNVGAY